MTVLNKLYIKFFSLICSKHPTRDICPILLEDFRKITVERRGEMNFFTSSMILSCMKKVVPVKFLNFGFKFFYISLQNR
jgi:hypothetical protein